MKFISTRGAAPAVEFRQALFDGLAPDGGLYVPDAFATHDLESLRGATLVELGTELAAGIIGGALSRGALQQLLQDALDFPLPLVMVGECAGVELFHGPTFAFKDVGARVMARLMAQLNTSDRELTVLVATSGDTGSAVAQAFHALAGTRVVVLFPRGAVTPVQDAQFTTLGGNIMAIEVAGSFDDCQRLAKEAFADQSLRSRTPLTSANSINIGRLLPQTFPYVHTTLLARGAVRFAVPSGNFGNLTAGVWAWRLGANIKDFIAATTVNDTFARFLATGHYQPAPAQATLASAMDVGDPSNVERLRWLFDDDIAAMRARITVSVHSDDDVRRTIAETFARDGYVCDPHTATALAALQQAADNSGPAVFLATAHPAKFKHIVEPLVRAHIPLPRELAEALSRPRHVERIDATLDELRPILAQ